MNLSKDQLNFYKENGYILIKNVIPLESINNLIGFISYAIKLAAKNINKSFDSNQEDILNELMYDIKKNNPKLGSWIFETVNSSYMFKKFIFNMGIENIVKQLMNTKSVQNLATVNPQLRIDVPEDSRNTRDWHQESFFFFDNTSGFDSLVSWIPLVNVNKENGSVMVCPQSHKEGKIKPIYIEGGPQKSEQYIVPSKNVEKYEQVTAIAEPGDIIFLHMDIFHKSGNNLSKNVRYIAQLRYSNLSKSDYNPPRQFVKYSEHS